MKVSDIRDIFIQKYKDQEFVTGRDGYKMIELIGASFVADTPAIFGTPNEEYIRAEIDWYESMSTNINDIYSYREPPAAWCASANEHGEINSNYGALVFSEKYYHQYQNVLRELLVNPNTRRATMVYNRPSIWAEYNENGKNDFICTNAVTYYIRNHKLHCVVQMRSNDVVYGYRNDHAWQHYLLTNLSDDIKIGRGDIHWQVQNLHIYERHFKLIGD
jgi:thymidylate synthase